MLITKIGKPKRLVNTFSVWVGCVVSFGMETDGGVVAAVAVAVVLAAVVVVVAVTGRSA